MDFNDWISTPIIHKSFIQNFEFLESNSLITHLEDDYFYLNIEPTKLEELYYSKKCKELANKLNIKDADKEIKQFIDQLNTYNELKDAADALAGKLADLKGKSLKEVREEFEFPQE